MNCARNQEETNLLAVQYKGSILFHCCRTIQPGDELVWWPSAGLVSRLSEAWSHMWLRKLCPTGEGGSYWGKTYLLVVTYTPKSKEDVLTRKRDLVLSSYFDDF